MVYMQISKENKQLHIPIVYIINLYITTGECPNRFKTTEKVTIFKSEANTEVSIIPYH